MPFCGYCGRPLAPGESCGCEEAVQYNSGTSAGLHDYVCRYCGASVAAGQTCNCPQAQFEARYVQNRPAPAQPVRPDATRAPAPVQRPMYGQQYGQQNSGMPQQGNPYNQQYNYPGQGMPYQQESPYRQNPYPNQQYSPYAPRPVSQTPKSGKGLAILAGYVAAVVAAASIIYAGSGLFSKKSDTSSKKSSIVQKTTAADGAVPGTY